MKRKHTSRIRRILLLVLAGLGLLLVLLVAVSALSNVMLPSRSQVVDRLGDEEKARVAEAVHLRQALGDDVWAGWGHAEIPIIVYNEEYAFLIGYPGPSRPPDGWVKVPQNLVRGGPWEEVPGDRFQGMGYYRQKLPGEGITPESFAVLVGDRWVSSLSTKEAMAIGISDQIKKDLPGPLAAILPYRVFGRVLVGNSDQYISKLLHESFHGYQGMTAEARLAASENANRLQANEYPWEGGALGQSWQMELDLLADAARSGSDTQARDLARQFLNVRDARRLSANLSPELVDFEQQREWLEGLAKYTELAIWRQAAASLSYTPSPTISIDPDFKRYATADERWSQELDQATRMAGDEGDGRFYYSGMLQAALLDRLAPDWKSHVLPADTWLEDLLREAVN